jgi:hypothetical protein
VMPQRQQQQTEGRLLQMARAPAHLTNQQQLLGLMLQASSRPQQVAQVPLQTAASHQQARRPFRSSMQSQWR